jgi:hypothetical protein
MRTLAAATALLALGGLASADGFTTRFGLTGAIEDQGAPGKVEVGPTVAVGVRGGPFVGEVEWAYLSFFEPDTTSAGVQRVGVNLRADVLRRYASHCMFSYACTRGSSLWVDAGVAERFGQWLLDAHDIAPAQSREPEAHVSVGIELDNQVKPMRNGWQLGLRFAVSPRGVGSATSCRTGGVCTTSDAPTTAIDKGGYDDSLLIEWTFLFGG